MIDAATAITLDTALARLACARDAEAWAAVLERVGGPMQQLALRLAGTSRLADDAVQEALLEIRDHADRFRAPEVGAEDAARRWILRIVAHATFSLLRRQRRAVARDRRAGHQLSEETKADPAEAIDRDERHDLVRRAVAALPDRQRTAISLHYISGLPVADVASELRCPLGTAKSHIRRGLERMRCALARSGLAIPLVGIDAAIRELPAVAAPRAVESYSAVIASTATASTSSLGVWSMSLKSVACAAVVASALVITNGRSEDRGASPSGGASVGTPVEAAAPPAVAQAVASVAAAPEGLVSAVRVDADGKQDLLMLTIGSAQGVAAGDEATISHSGNYVVRAQVERILNDMVACRIIPGSWNENGVKVRQGDLGRIAKPPKSVSTVRRVDWTSAVTEVQTDAAGEQTTIIIAADKEAFTGSDIHYYPDCVVCRGEQVIVKANAGSIADGRLECRIVPDSWNADGQRVQPGDQVRITVIGPEAGLAQLRARTDATSQRGDAAKVQQKTAADTDLNKHFDQWFDGFRPFDESGAIISDGLKRQLKERIDLVQDGVEAGKVLETLFAIAGVNYLIPSHEGLQEKVTLHLRNETVEAALAMIARMCSLRYEYIGDTVVVVNGQNPGLAVPAGLSNGMAEKEFAMKLAQTELAKRVDELARRSTELGKSMGGLTRGTVTSVHVDHDGKQDTAMVKVSKPRTVPVGTKFLMLRQGILGSSLLAVARVERVVEGEVVCRVFPFGNNGPIQVGDEVLNYSGVDALAALVIGEETETSTHTPKPLVLPDPQPVGKEF
jgi:RNA polymerase sigma factor (sigma-70 family)